MGFVYVRTAGVAIGLLIAVLLILDALVVIAMYSYSSNGAEYNCSYLDSDTSADASCRDRTAALGILAGGVGLLIGIFFLVAFIATFFVSSLNRGMKQIIALAVSVFLAAFAFVSFGVAFALMAKDIDDFHGDTRNNPGCDTPGGWAAALSFALFGFIGWFVMGVWIVFLFIVIRVFNLGSEEV